MKAPFYLPLSLVGLTVVFPLSAEAQIMPDGSLGAEGSVVVPAVIKGLPSDQLEGGAVRGGNLFHSFGEFSVPDGRGAYFANPAGVANIFSRVTGGNISQIFGTLGVLGNANLYFLNPNGIVFGPNARLDLRGSFLATTAASFLFENGFEFSSVNPAGPPLLTVNIPIGLSFRDNATAKIASQGVLSAGQDLTLAGNNLDLQGQVISGKNLTLTAEDTVKIRDYLDSPFIAAAGGELRVQGKQAVDIFALNHPESGFFSRGNLTLSSANSVGGDARFNSAGSFRVEGLNGALGELTSPNDPVIRAGGDVLIGSYEGASLHIIAGGKVEITDYALITGADGEYGLQEAVSLADGTAVNIDGKTQPTLDIRAGVSPEAIGEPFFNGSGAGEPLDFPDSPTSADISVGSILFRDGEFNPITGQVLLTNQYFPNPNLTGDIQVQSTLGDLGFGAIETGGPASGGLVTLSSQGSLYILGGINLASQGTGGTLSANAVNDIWIQDSIISARGSQGGQIDLKGQNIFIEGEISRIRAGIDEGLGSPTSQGGDITLQAVNLFSLNGGVISNLLNNNAQGNSGDVIIRADSVSLTNGGIVNVSAFPESQGNAGKIEITANQDISLSGLSSGGLNSSLVNTIQVGAEGNTGGIILQASNLSLNDTAQINASVYGKGNVGPIDIIAKEGVFISGETSAITGILSNIYPSAEGNSSGIFINTSSLEIVDGGTISASTLGAGNAGIIEISADQNIILRGQSLDGFASTIYSTIEEGGQGNSDGITIVTNSLTLRDGALITASTLGKGNSGKVQVTASEALSITGESSSGAGGGILSQIQDIPQSEGNSEGISIYTKNLFLSDGGRIDASTFGKGNAGAVEITAVENLSIVGADSLGFISGIISGVGIRGEGNAEGIKIQTGYLSLLEGGTIDSSTAGQGNAGVIQIEAVQGINVSGESNQGLSSAIFSQVVTTAAGDSGGIFITTPQLSLRDGGLISTDTFGQGNAGDVEIKASESILIIGEDSQGFNSGIFSGTNTELEGNSGTLSLETSLLYLDDGGLINAATQRRGNAGKITIKAQDITLLGQDSQGINSSIVSIVGESAIGSSAGITIETSNLSLEEGTLISSSTFGQGDAGLITINALESIALTGEDAQGFGGRVISEVREGAIGNSEGILIDTKTLAVGNGGRISASTAGEGNAGTVTITATQSLTVTGQDSQALESAIDSTVQATGQGNSGAIAIETPILILSQGGAITASTLGAGDAGDINIRSSEWVELRGTSTSLQSQTQGASDAGNITITTPVFTVTDGAEASVATTGAGSPGDIFIQTNRLDIGANAELSATVTPASTNTQGGGSITLQSSELNISGQLGIFAETQGAAPAGNLRINPNDNNPDLNIRFTDDGFISARTTAGGQGGNIDISAPNVIDIRGQGRITAETSGAGNAGSIEFTSQRLNLADGVEVSATTTGTGNAGNIRVNTPVNLTIEANSRLTAETQSAGRAGDITVTAETINLGTNAELSARATQTSTNPEGGGSINLNASNLNISGQLGIFAETQGQAPAGNLTIRPELTPDLNIRFTEEGFISALTTASGQGGNIDISAPDLIDIRGQGRITTETSGSGNAGVINLNSQRLNLQDGVAVSASTSNSGQGGSLTISAPDSIRLQGAQLSTEATSAGEAGDINLTTRQLELTENGRISASSDRSRGGDVRLQNLETLTVNQGEISASTADGSAGSLTVNSNQLAVNRVSLNQGSLAVKATGAGNSGNLSVNARTVELNNGAEISASTNSGAGGNITLLNLDSLDINNSEISASTATGSAGSILINSAERVRLQNQGRITVEATDGGRAGNLELTTDTLTVTENSRVSVSSLTGQAGNINIRVKDLLLDRGAITAETGTSDQESGANINISASNLLTLRLQNESLISATANADADGGNIQINAPFLLAYPATGADGSDIIAKAVRGAGGQITVNALGIFGISEGRAIAGNRTNNFDASSEFGAPGVVQLNQAVDPNRGLTQLPETVTDPNELIAQNVCRRGKESELTQTGKGGLPPSLEDDFQGEPTLPPLVEPIAPQSSAPTSSSPTPISSKDLQPAQGWILNAQGQVELVSYQTEGLEVRRSAPKSTACP